MLWIKKTVGIRLDEKTISFIESLVEMHNRYMPVSCNFSDMLRQCVENGSKELYRVYYDTVKSNLDNCSTKEQRDDFDSIYPEPEGWIEYEEELEEESMVNTGVKPGRNDKCTCGSGKKYKYCCGK